MWHSMRIHRRLLNLRTIVIAPLSTTRGCPRMFYRLAAMLIAVASIHAVASTAQAQMVIQSSTLPTSIVPSRAPTLEDYLVSHLRATSDDQRAYVREVVKLVKKGRFEQRLVLALERRARGKNPVFPLPVFERTLRYEAARRRITVPTIDEIVARNGASAARSIQDSRLNR